MPLFMIQDDDRPAWVVAENYTQALERWIAVVKEENDGDEGDPPNGISYICDDTDLILEGGLVEKLRSLSTTE